MKGLYLAMSLASLAVLVSIQAASQNVNVTTWHNDIGRTGQNILETTLTPTNVNKNQFGKVCSASVDGQVYAQPLVVTGLQIANGHPVVYVVTMNDTVYAFDGTNCSSIQGLPPTSLLQTGEVAVQCGDVGNKMCKVLNPTIGVLGTPVIDANTNIMYVVSWAEIQSSQTFTHRLHALDITNFTEKFGGPVTISATVGNLSFTSVDHIQRPGLLFLSGPPPVVYAAFSMMDGATCCPNGWVLGYNASTLAASGAFPTTTTTGGGGGVWQGAAGLAAGNDAHGGPYIYLGTGNGDYDGSSNWGDTFVKLKTDLTAVSNSFTPFDAYCREACMKDVDFGSGGVMLIPDGTLASPYGYLAVIADKTKNIWVMDRTNPGAFNGSNNGNCPPTCTGTNANLETIPGSNEFHNTAAYWNGYVYYDAISQSLKRYPVASSCTNYVYGPPLCATPSTAPSANTFPYGTTPSVSANGTTNGIVWTIWQDGSAQKGNQARLYAYSSDLTSDLFDTTMCTSGVDALNPGTKFSVPTVANGHVYVGTQDATGFNGTFYIFGLITGKNC